MGFASGVKIKMLDGTEISIAEIRIGQSVLGGNGQRLTVMDNITGIDEELLQIKTDKLPLLQLTSTSIVMTAAGEKQALQLVCGDVLQCVQDCTATVQKIDKINYNDNDYSLIFDEKSIFYANGIAVGSFDAEVEYQDSHDSPKMEEYEKRLLEEWPWK